MTAGTLGTSSRRGVRCARSRSVRSLADAVGRFVLPAWCLSCDDSLGWPTPALCLCNSCRDRLSPPPERCPLCGSRLPERSAAWLCAACVIDAPAFDRLLGQWTYEPPAAQVIRGLKYQGLQFLADDIVGEIVSGRGDDLSTAELVTEVPLHWRRKTRRGFDQAGLLAVALAAHLDLPYRPLLRRCRATAPQTSFGRAERRRNVEAAFTARRATRTFHHQHALLVDDVATTGATLDEAAKVLKQSGIGEITAVVAAVTPKSTEC